MSDLQRLLDAYDTERQMGNACALATVVEVIGSAYRQPGARMLVTSDGRLTGTISGGCLEGDARRKAQKVMYSGKPEIICYDSTDIEDDLENGAQLGCQGQVFILLEPLDFNDPHNPLVLLRETFHLSQPSVLATVLKSSNDAIAPTAQRLLLINDELKGGNIHQSLVDQQLAPDMREVLRNGVSHTRDYDFAGTTVNVFLELIKPAPTLTIYGAGNDVQPLVELARRLGWKITVVDGRPALASKERFPGAGEVKTVRVNDLQKHAPKQGFAVLMSHNYHYDLAALQGLAGAATVNYIGILGPRKKTDRMLNELGQQGIDIAELNKRIHSPVGLDIGGENADEIALSIMAELLAVYNGLRGGFLRDIDAPIHNRNPIINTYING